MGKRLIRACGAQERANAAPLFANWDETLIGTSLQGRMGSVWQLSATAAVCLCGDFVFAAAGEGEEKALLEAVRAHLSGRFAILASRDDGLLMRVPEVFGRAACAQTRYAFDKHTAFDRNHLGQLARSILPGVRLVAFDDSICRMAAQQEWSRDFCSQFEGAEDYLRRGVGVAALYAEQLVGGASSYICYDGGIEIELDTHRDWRGRGIATACAARLILTCLDRGLYPSWDAASLTSVHIAQRLGYGPGHPYPVWHLNE